MSDWIKHDGGPQPVADDVWVHVVDPIEGSYQSTASGADWDDARHYFVLNQHLIDAARKEEFQKGVQAFDETLLALEADISNLIDAARLEGIRLGLEAAAKALWEDEDWEDAIGVTELIRALDPDTIAREATDKETAR